MEVGSYAVDLNSRCYLDKLFDVHVDLNAWNLACKLRDNGLLCKPTHSDILRFAPALTMNEEQMLEACDIIRKTVDSL